MLSGPVVLENTIEKGTGEWRTLDNIATGVPIRRIPRLASRFSPPLDSRIGAYSPVPSRAHDFQSEE